MSFANDRIARRKKLKAEGWPRTLTELFERSGVSFDRCAHMTIDVQERYIVTDQIEDIAGRLKNHIAPAFNRLGIPTYWIYWPEPDSPYAHSLDELVRENYKMGAAAIYDIWPAEIDKVLPKMHSSAFQHGLLQNIEGPTLTELTLEEDQVELLLVDGFLYKECITDNILDAAQRGYLIALLEDGTDGPVFPQLHSPKLIDAGVVFLNSDEAIDTLKKRALQKPTIAL